MGRPLTPPGVTQVKFAKEVVTTNQQLFQGWMLVCVGQAKFAKEVVIRQPGRDRCNDKSTVVGSLNHFQTYQAESLATVARLFKFLGVIRESPLQTVNR
ncbi:hypothetical protein [[Phormidium] sp. ETS-05]|uniref:hypothetical protein n=1 Tax=[Phormidium] sp. ETS-05 TaxID=222819 RepID=UPI0018EF024F|nr:hypothetical protein [[Phormidium] sp. ETS-05]